jgi:hypothetical protein
MYPSSYQRIRWSGTLRRGRPQAASFHPAWMAPVRSTGVSASRRMALRELRLSATQDEKRPTQRRGPCVGQVLRSPSGRGFNVTL